MYLLSASNRGDVTLQALCGACLIPVLVRKHEHFGRQKLLKRPSSCKSPAFPKHPHWIILKRENGDIDKICIADLRILVPSKHRINRL